MENLNPNEKDEKLDTESLALNNDSKAENTKLESTGMFFISFNPLDTSGFSLWVAWIIFLGEIKQSENSGDNLDMITIQAKVLNKDSKSSAENQQFKVKGNRGSWNFVSYID